MTLRELVIEHDAYQIDRWWHTAMIVSQVYNLQTIVVNAFSKKSKLKPKAPSELHPFIKPVTRGMKVTKKNFSVLKALGNALCKKG